MKRRQRRELQDLETKKLKQFEARTSKTGVEAKFLEAMGAETHQNLLEINQIIRRRGIIKNID